LVLDIFSGKEAEQCFAPRVEKPSKRTYWKYGRAEPSGVALELSLRFPHVHVLFYGPSPAQAGVWLAAAAKDLTPLPAERLTLHFAESQVQLASALPVMTRFAAGFRSYFDPTGFRTVLRNCLIGSAFGTTDDWSNTHEQRVKILGERLTNLAVAVDEEFELALLHSYAAYKFGCRAWTISTYEEFRGEQKPDWRTAGVTSVLRDIDLRFPDIPDDKYTQIRDKLKSPASDEWRLPPGCQVRAISANITMGDAGGDWSEPERLLGERQGVPLGLTKPLASMYAIRGLLPDGMKGSVVGKLCGVGLTSTGGHSAPYTNLVMAQALLARASRCRAANSITGYLLAALFAQDAACLLLGMSRNIALEAIREMSLSEVGAEAHCLGVAHSVSLRQRRDDLRAQALGIERGFACAFFLARVWAELRVVYRDAEQFRAAETANFESICYCRWLLPARWWKRGATVPFKRVALLPVRSLWALAATYLLANAALASFFAISQGWRLDLRSEGLHRFFALMKDVFVAVSRGGDLSSSYQRNFLFHLTDCAAATCTIVFIGVIASLVFRKLVRS